MADSDNTTPLPAAKARALVAAGLLWLVRAINPPRVVAVISRRASA